MSIIYRYFDVLTEEGVITRFRKNRFTRRISVFQRNCAEPCSWHPPGYGYGKWTPL